MAGAGREGFLVRPVANFLRELHMRRSRTAHLAAVLASATLALLAAPAEASAWGGSTRGNGKKVTQARSLPEFSKVRLEGSLEVKVKVGAASAVSVTIDENLQPLVATRVEGDTLVIECESMSYRDVGRVEVSTPTLFGFDIEGSGDVAIDGGAGDISLSVAGSGDLAWRGAAAALAVAIAGSGDVKLSGTADSAKLEIDGSGDIHAAGLTAKSAKAEVSGSGDIEVTLGGGSLEAQVSGSGDIHWHGTAQVERVSVSGSGEISRR